MIKIVENCDNKTRVLILNTIGFGLEGITSVIKSYSDHISREKFELTYISFWDTTLIQDLFAKNGDIIILPDRKSKTSKYCLALNKYLTTHDVDVFHINGNSSTMLLEVAIARKNRVKNIIVHCHSNGTEHPAINNLLKPFIQKINVKRVACSVDAGDALFGSGNYELLKNAIDVNRFKFCATTRRRVREELNIIDECVIGHVGYYSSVKNQDFIIEVFKEFHNRNHKSKLMLVSNWKNENPIYKKAKQYNILDDVIFLDRTKNIEDYYQVFDVFIFPSIYEGLGLVAIEAQASGLPVVASTGVPMEAKCSENIIFLSLNEKIQVWVETLEKMIKRNVLRTEPNIFADITTAGYNIEKECLKLEHLYLEK